jgi:hypothetical protein
MADGSIYKMGNEHLGECRFPVYQTNDDHLIQPYDSDSVVAAIVATHTRTRRRGAFPNNKAFRGFKVTLGEQF